MKNLEIPWGMEFLPNGDFLFCERSGKINLMRKRAKDYTTILFRSVLVSEGGLLGLAVDPKFSSNGYFYIYETVSSGNRVVRMRLVNDAAYEDKVLLDKIPRAYNHNGGALRFGPDGYLYAGTGDAQDPSLAQDTASLAGKILRMDRNGSIPLGNPFGNYVWTLGHRNVQGFAWNKQGKMIATEHGPSGEFGWCCHDEINLIEPGKNYGWPIYLAGTEVAPYTKPLAHSGTDTWAPSGCTFVNGKEWRMWENNFIMACLRGKRAIRFVLNENATQVLDIRDTLSDSYQRLRNLIQAPDGALLFSSSNIGTANPPPLPGDDKIYRMFWE